MNIWPVVFASISKFRFTVLTFTLLVVVGVAVSVAVLSQERALREGSARAAERFDLIVAPQGSSTDALLTGVYLQPGSARLLSPEATAKVLNDTSAVFASPLAFGDNYAGHPIVGATAPLVDHLSGGLAEGAAFSGTDEAVVGASVKLALGATIVPSHGLHDRGDGEDAHDENLTVVGRLQPTGSPWDNAIVVPVEFVWHVHEEEGQATEGGEPAAHVDEDHDHDHDHDHEELTIGGPYTVDNPGVPAVVLHVGSVAEAYRLRSAYNTDETMAFFPAEVLVDLYRTLGDVSFVMFMLSLFSALLVVVAIVAGLFIMFRLLMSQFVTLRAIGAPPRYILGISWGISATIFSVGATLGMLGGWALAQGVSYLVQQRTGIALTPGIGRQEITVVLSIWALGIVVGLVPALYIARKPLWQTIRAY